MEKEQLNLQLTPPEYTLEGIKISGHALDRLRERLPKEEKSAIFALVDKVASLQNGWEHAPNQLINNPNYTKDIPMYKRTNWNIRYGTCVYCFNWNKKILITVIDKYSYSEKTKNYIAVRRKYKLNGTKVGKKAVSLANRKSRIDYKLKKERLHAEGFEDY